MMTYRSVKIRCRYSKFILSCLNGYKKGSMIFMDRDYSNLDFDIMFMNSDNNL